jgi:hypothetical protein
MMRVTFSCLFSPIFLKSVNWSMAFLLSLGVTLGLSAKLKAAEPSTAPTELKTLMSQIDTTANQHDFEQMKNFYSPNFTNNDGLDYKTLEKALKSLWTRYPDLKYKTELISWEKEGENLVTLTQTHIEGTGKLQENPSSLQGTIKSRQTFQGNKLLRQEILNENITLTTGQNPPEIDIKLPEVVRTGQEFDFDVILKDPMAGNLFAGAALNQETDPENYLNPSALDIELLQAGGLFKRAKAPNKPANRWLSGVIIGADGTTWVTQRLRVEK